MKRWQFLRERRICCFVTIISLGSLNILLLTNWHRYRYTHSGRMTSWTSSSSVAVEKKAARLSPNLQHPQSSPQNSSAKRSGAGERVQESHGHRQATPGHVSVISAGQREATLPAKTLPKRLVGVERDGPVETPLWSQDPSLPQGTPRGAWTPPPDAGEGGVGVEVDRAQLSAEQRRRVREGERRHGFNEFLSSFISLHRSPPTIRQPLCRQQQQKRRASLARSLPAATVVMVFHNEAWSTLLRTVHSVLAHSPPLLLPHVILVDDASHLEHLKAPLDSYVRKLKRVQLIRNERRGGVVSSRLLGLSRVSTPVVIFMDSHCECTEGWLEPLLECITEDPTTVAIPVIDVIRASDFRFQVTNTSRLQVGSFDWRLTYRWVPMSASQRQRRTSSADPVPTPVMAGGLFAVDKKFFQHLGSYDEAMTIWGGENLDLSFRVWMCGGKLEIIPCSHVGHVFRTSVTDPVRNSDHYLTTNLGRVAAVWMDEYSYYSNQARGINMTSRAVTGDVSSRRALRQRLQCHSFAWYLQTLLPDSYLPADLFAHGVVKNVGTGLCIATSLFHYREAHLVDCQDDEESQIWRMNEGQWTVFQNGFFGDVLCLDPPSNGTVRVLPCHGQGEGGSSSQLWSYSQEQKQLVHVNSGQCAEVRTSPPPHSSRRRRRHHHHRPSFRLLLAPCHHGNRLQQWSWDTSPVPGPSWRKDMAAARPVL